MYVGLIPMILSVAKGHAFVPMVLFVTKEFMHFSCICSYQFSHVYIFFPVQRHEDSWKLACLMYPAAFHNEKLVIKFVELVTGREESILSVVGIKAAAGYLQNKWEKVTVFNFILFLVNQ